MNRSRIVSVLLACLIVTAGVAGPLSQPAQAQTVTDECNPLDRQVSFLLNPLKAGAEGMICVADYYSDLQDYQTVDTEQTKVDIYSSLSQTKETSQQYGTTFDNYMNDSETVAWSKMQVAVAESYQNGSTEIQARNNGDEAIEEYYAVQQRNLVARWNAMITNVHRAIELRNNDSNIAGTFIYNAGAGEIQINKADPVNMTLVNGSTVEVMRLQNGNGNYMDITGGEGPNFSEWQVHPPTGSFDNLKYKLDPAWPSRWNRVQNKVASVKSESETYINATYDDYQDGSVNASDVISSQTAMFEYGTAYDGNQTSLYDSVGALALAGYDTPSLNGTGTMDVRYNNQTYTGLVMARTVPGGSWSANTTYNTSNIDGPVFVATTTGTKVDIPEGESFTVEAIRAQDGTSISNVSTTRYNYKTANASELMEVQQRLTSLRAELEERETSGGAGGGSGGFGGNTILIVLAVAAAAAIALGSQNGGGRRGRRR